MMPNYHLKIQSDNRPEVTLQLTQNDYCIRDIRGFEKFSHIFHMLDLSSKGLRLKAWWWKRELYSLTSYFDEVSAILPFNYFALFNGESSSATIKDGYRLQLFDGSGECYIAIIDDVPNGRRIPTRLGEIDLRQHGSSTWFGLYVKVTKKRSKYKWPQHAVNAIKYIEEMDDNENICVSHSVER